MLDDFLGEYCDWKHEQNDPVEFAPDEKGNYWLVLQDCLQRVSVSLIQIQDSQDDHAIVVESAVGKWSDQLDVRSLLLMSGSKMLISRFSLCPRDLEDILVVESAVPYQSITLPLFDRMIREVMSLVTHLLTPARVEE